MQHPSNSDNQYKNTNVKRPFRSVAPSHLIGQTDSDHTNQCSTDKNKLTIDQKTLSNENQPFESQPPKQHINNSTTLELSTHTDLSVLDASNVLSQQNTNDRFPGKSAISDHSFVDTDIDHQYQTTNTHEQQQPSQANNTSHARAYTPKFSPHDASAYNSAKHKLTCQNIAKSYRNNQVLQQITLEISNGEAVGILGPNGAGKTTCFYILTGLIRPDSGVINLNGHDITHLPMNLRAKLGIGYLPQETSIFRDMNVEDNILAVLQLGKLTIDEQKVRLESLLNEFSIVQLRKQFASSLSGGERRRLEIARALANNPTFILLDEPLAGIDPVTVKDIRKMVNQLKKNGIGVLITDHNVAETLKIVDRAYVIRAGTILAEGTPKEIASHKEVRQYYLGEDFNLHFTSSTTNSL